MSQTPRPAPPSRISGWKSIAGYLGRDRTTAMRWAATRGLPVHQVPGGKRASVYALGEELDRWMTGVANDPAPAQPSFPLDRRGLILGGVLAGLAGTGVALSLKQREPVAPKVSGLMEQARTLLYQNTRETQNQAIGLYREAVRAAPRFADAWGMLGYAYAFVSHWRPQAESELLRQQAKMAGQSALDLDPGNALGELALANALPFLGASDWLARDRGLRRALAGRPGNPDILFLLGFILRFTGHAGEAAAMCERIAPRQQSPATYNVRIRALWSSGRTNEALRLLDQAASLYPTQRTLWQSRLEVLMFSGRAEQAARIARDEQSRPGNVTSAELAKVFALAQHLSTPDSGRIDAFLAELRQDARTGEREAVTAIRFASVTGRLDDAFAIADAYFFGRGFVVGDSLGNGLYVAPDQRHTNYLFEPPLAAMRADHRFARLTEELGLERFWRQTGRPPDYRRG